MAVQCFAQEIFALIGPEHLPRVRLYGIAYLLATAAQIITMLRMLFVRRSRAYSDAVQRAKRQRMRPQGGI